MKDTQYFYDFILGIDSKNKNQKGYSIYGSRIVEILDLYDSIETFEERKAFKEAIEQLLMSGNKDLIEFGITICTGFIDFRKKYV